MTDKPIQLSSGFLILFCFVLFDIFCFCYFFRFVFCFGFVCRFCFVFVINLVLFACCAAFYKASLLMCIMTVRYDCEVQHCDCYTIKLNKNR